MSPIGSQRLTLGQIGSLTLRLRCIALSGRSELVSQDSTLIVSPLYAQSAEACLNPKP